MDRQADEQEAEEEIQMEAMELRGEAEEDYHRKVADFRRQQDEWKNWRRKQVGGLLSLSGEGTSSLSRGRTGGKPPPTACHNEQPCPFQRAKKKKKKKKRRGQEEEEEDEDDRDDEDDDQDEGGGDLGEGPAKPRPPDVPDLGSVELEVREKASRIRRKPGDPILVPELTTSGNITTNDQCPR